MNEVHMGHKCEFLLKAQANNAYRISVVNHGNSWYLKYLSFATEIALYNQEADELGEVLTDVQLLISFCPFCGTKLL